MAETLAHKPSIRKRRGIFAKHLGDGLCFEHLLAIERLVPLEQVTRARVERAVAGLDSPIQPRRISYLVIAHGSVASSALRQQLFRVLIIARHGHSQRGEKILPQE